MNPRSILSNFWGSLHFERTLMRSVSLSFCNDTIQLFHELTIFLVHVMIITERNIISITRVCKMESASKAQNPVTNFVVGQSVDCQHLPIAADVARENSRSSSVLVDSQDVFIIVFYFSYVTFIRRRFLLYLSERDHPHARCDIGR